MQEGTRFTLHVPRKNTNSSVVYPSKVKVTVSLYTDFVLILGRMTEDRGKNEVHFSLLEGKRLLRGSVSAEVEDNSRGQNEYDGLESKS